MEYSVNFGIWNGVFAVPNVIVDEHIKLAGATQLKVILWMLRHSGEKFDINEISKALNMQTADVKDCMQYWVQVGVISPGGNEAKPAETQGDDKNITNSVVEQKEEKKTPKVRMYQVDLEYVSKRMSEDKNIAYLMEMADNLYERMTSTNDKSVLLSIHEYYGMPIEVIIMMMQYLKSVNRCYTGSIKQMADKWWKKEIFDLNSADKEIKRLEAGKASAVKIQKIIGDCHSPTEQEINTAELWMDQWKLSEELIRFAYETCVNSIGKYNPGYMKKIVESWHNKGITTVEKAKNELESRQKASKKIDDSSNSDWEILKGLSVTKRS